MNSEDLDKIEDFLSSPVKICTIALNEQDLKKLPNLRNRIAYELYNSSDMKEQVTQACVDLKIRNSDVYLTLKGKARELEEIDPFLGSGFIYNLIVEKMTKDPQSVQFQGSLDVRDFVKIYEISARHSRQYLNDDQFNLIYKAMIEMGTQRPDSNKISYIAISGWLEKIILNGSTTLFNKYYGMYCCEEDLLEENDLKKEELVREQQRFLSDKKHDYYLLERDYEYMSEFMLASKKKNIVRSDVSLLREELGFSLTEGTVQSNTFKKIFDKRKEKDLELEF
jgi:hypothetical protein